MSVVTEDPPSAAIQYSNFDMLVITQGHETLPDGTQYEIEVGNLALGAPNVNQTWGGVDGSMVTSYPFINDQIPSNSFGIHIGSTAVGIPPSLYIGGYDQTRVLGDVTVQKYNMHYFPIDLLDIGIGVAEGASPFTFSSKSGLLASGNSSIGVSMEVIIDPIAPFLYLPKSTCDVITAPLPVIYQPNLGLYFWDTTSPSYHAIISSPAFLSFTLRLNASVTQNLTINVPFSLLNLTLTAPLVQTPTQYFPCNPFDYGKSYGGYTLGKAFLQAAFLGVNWGAGDSNGSFFLAQAPGPNTPSEAAVKSIAVDDQSVVPSTNVWADTWKGSWTPLVASSTASPSSSSSGQASEDTHPGVSTKAIVGIAVGIVVLALLGMVGGYIVWRKRKARKSTEERIGVEYQAVEVSGDSRPRWEMDGGTPRVEADGKSRAELRASTIRVELP
jgi:hypothetical protein